MKRILGRLSHYVRYVKIGALSFCDLLLNIDHLPEISKYFELLSAQVSYPDFRVPKVVQSTLHSVNVRI